MTYHPPSASQRPYEMTQHGRTRRDEYYWMRDRNDPETIAYLQAENAYMEQAMAHTTGLQDELYHEMKARIPERDLSAPEKRGDYWYYRRIEPGMEYPVYCRRAGGMDGEEETLLDLNALAKGQVYCALGAFEISPDQSRLAYLLDTAGNEIYTLLVKDLRTGELLPERIGNLGGYLPSRTGLAWTKDGAGLYYNTLDSAHRADKLYCHILGTDPATDRLVYEERNPVYGMHISPSRSADYLWVVLNSTSSNEVRFLSLAQPGAELRVVVERQAMVEYSVDDPGDGRILIRTNAGAPNFRLVEAPVADPRQQNWRELLPNRDDVTLESIQAFRDHLAVIERRDGLRQVRLSAPDGTSQVRYIPMPESAYSLQSEINPVFDTRVLRFRYTSLATPLTVVDYDMAAATWTAVKVQEIPSGYDASQYVTERVFAPAPDGKQVPVSLVYRKGMALDGSAPLLLYGYGSYGASMDPAFSADRLSLLERGVIYALAHVRGGADMGRGWYEDGRLMHKKNSFTDLIACADMLVGRGYTSRAKMAIMGRSAGGLLVGAVMTMRPDVCGAVVAQVPFVDVVTTMSDATIPLTTFEYDQWGNPDVLADFNYMLSYSPYDNLRPTDYPDLLLTTGLNDPRVAYWEPAKFAARLRALKTNDSLTLLHTNFGAGHGGSSGRYAALKETAMVYAFLLDRLAK